MPHGTHHKNFTGFVRIKVAASLKLAAVLANTPDKKGDLCGGNARQKVLQELALLIIQHGDIQQLILVNPVKAEQIVSSAMKETCERDQDLNTGRPFPALVIGYNRRRDADGFGNFFL